jgi:acetyl-CoA synthetase
LASQLTKRHGIGTAPILEKTGAPWLIPGGKPKTGGILISALSGISATKPTYAGQPLPGVQPVLLDAQGNEITENNTEGLLCIKFPWPSIVRTIYGDHESCRQIYFAPL